MRILFHMFCIFSLAGAFASTDENLDYYGVSTAAYQIEGSWDKDGKGVSIWDHFTHTKKMENGDVACDEYHRVPETIALLKDLGVNVYRFSIAWTRILPNGTGEVNPKGLAYYRFLINELKKAHIAPMVTLYHWDLPQALEDKGGWTNRETAYLFANYARILFQEFGEDVKFWITHNEPRVVSTRGYGSADMAPGLNNPAIVPLVDHHLLLSHGLAVQAFREFKLKSKIGIALNLKPIYCFEKESIVEAAGQDVAKNRNYVEPILLGKYPNNSDAPYIKIGDMLTISQPIDFLGVNYYSRMVVAPAEFVPQFTNALGWETYPSGIYDILMSLKNNYSKVPPIFITENGYADNLDDKEPIQDMERVAYLKTHLNMVKQAKKDGAPVVGYLVWSLMDNFEWSFGYKPRFGLVHVDFATQKRTPKASYYVYQKIVLDALK